MQLPLEWFASEQVVAVVSAHVWPLVFVHLNCRHANGEVNHAWLIGAAAVPAITLLATWETLWMGIVVTPPVWVASVGATKSSHWANATPLVKVVVLSNELRVLTVAITGGGMVCVPPTPG